VDDDNWLFPEWVNTVAEVMSQHPDVGACGGLIEAVCESTPPSWFERFKSCYAPGSQGQEEGGDVTWRGFLMGAGLTIRKSSWEPLKEKGFKFLLSDRKGKSLSAGGDHELCLALCLAGWRLWYEPRLRLQHFLPATRLDWHFLRRQTRGAGMCEAGLAPYRFALQPVGQESNLIKRGLRRMRERWLWQTLRSIRYLVRQPMKLILSSRYTFEGDPNILWVEQQIGLFWGLIDMRKTYNSNVRDIRNASWRAKCP
jgi:hypothetical protein